MDDPTSSDSTASTGPTASLRSIAVGLLVAQTLMVGGIVGALSLRHAEEPVEAMAVQLTSEVCTRVEVRLETILKAPLLLTDLNADAVRGAGLDPEGPTAPFEALFARQLQRFPVSLTYMGTPSGAYVGARRVDDQTITISLSSADTDFRNVRWATNAEGHRTDVLLRSEERYDARTRPWFTAASDTAEARWTDIYMDFTSGALAITASRRLGGTRASAGAVLATDLLLDDLGRFPGDLDLGRGGLLEHPENGCRAQRDLTAGTSGTEGGAHRRCVRGEGKGEGDHVEHGWARL